MNFLEQLTVEYYTYRGYWVHHNVRLSRLGIGGYDGRMELDVVALHPERNSLVHVEVGGGRGSWPQLESEYAKKKEGGKMAYQLLFPGVALPSVRLRAIWESAVMKDMGGCEVLPLRSFLQEVDADLPERDFQDTSVNEQLPILRTLHLSRWLRL